VNEITGAEWVTQTKTGKSAARMLLSEHPLPSACPDRKSHSPGLGNLPIPMPGGGLSHAA
jgi:hypothetical protein